MLTNQVAHQLGPRNNAKKPKRPILPPIQKGTPTMAHPFSEEEYRKGIPALNNNNNKHMCLLFVSAGFLMSSVDHLHAEENVLKVREHSELLSAQYLARCLEPEIVNNSITTRDPPKRRMKETLFTRHRSTVEPMMIAKDRKATLQAIHTMAVNQAVTSLRRNVVLDDRSLLINIFEKELTRMERTTLAQLRSGHCRLLGSFFLACKISKYASLDVCADCGKTPHDVKHVFNCPAHPTTMTPSDLWNRRNPVDAIRELGYLEAGVLD